jgi:RyR domain
MINDRQADQIARAIHENYVAEQTRDGVAMGSMPAMAPWDDLDEDKREANRAQARDIEAKLAKIGCRVGRGTVPPGFTFTDKELEALARHEQSRWASQRTAAGWVYGATRDDTAKVHPSLVSWDELPESEKDKDRDAVRNIPAVLAAAGLRVIRERRSARATSASARTTGTYPRGGPG